MQSLFDCNPVCTIDTLNINCGYLKFNFSYIPRLVKKMGATISMSFRVALVVSLVWRMRGTDDNELLFHGQSLSKWMQRFDLSSNRTHPLELIKNNKRVTIYASSRELQQHIDYFKTSAKWATDHNHSFNCDELQINPTVLVMMVEIVNGVRGSSLPTTERENVLMQNETDWTWTHWSRRVTKTLAYFLVDRHSVIFRTIQRRYRLPERFSFVIYCDISIWCYDDDGLYGTGSFGIIGLPQLLQSFQVLQGGDNLMINFPDGLQQRIITYAYRNKEHKEQYLSDNGVYDSFSNSQCANDLRVGLRDVFAAMQKCVFVETNAYAKTMSETVKRYVAEYTVRKVLGQTLPERRNIYDQGLKLRQTVKITVF